MRPGAISEKEISKILNKKVTFTKPKKIKKVISPGLLKRHYSPGIPIKLNCKKNDDKAAFIVLGKKYNNNKNLFNLSKKNDLKEAAKNYTKYLEKLKN